MMLSNKNIREMMNNKPDIDWVYFIRGASSGNIKIGYSNDPINRCKEFNKETGSSEHKEIVAIIEGGQKKEAELHKRFRQYRIKNQHNLKNEWFRPEQELLDFIADVVSGAETEREKKREEERIEQERQEKIRCKEREQRQVEELAWLALKEKELEKIRIKEAIKKEVERYDPLKRKEVRREKEERITAASCDLERRPIIGFTICVGFILCLFCNPFIMGCFINVNKVTHDNVLLLFPIIMAPTLFWIVLWVLIAIIYTCYIKILLFCEDEIFKNYLRVGKEDVVQMEIKDVELEQDFKRLELLRQSNKLDYEGDINENRIRNFRTT